MLKLPSLGHLLASASAAARRFPEVVACAMGAGCAGVVALEPGSGDHWWALAQRYGHLTLTLHLAVAVVPYVTVTEPHGFWQYNWTLLFRFLLATLYAAALFIGLGLALAAVDNRSGFWPNSSCCPSWRSTSRS